MWTMLLLLGYDGPMGLVRLFLALVVAADHWRQHFVAAKLPFIDDDTFKLGFNSGYAVLFFYVISGFLITYTLSMNYTTDVAGTLGFYRKRFIRIFSLYWPLLILSWLLFPVEWSHFLAAGAWDKMTNIFLIGMDWRIPFASYPAEHWAAAPGAIHQAWTLGAELTFYLVAPLLMRSWKVAVLVLVASFGARAAFVMDAPSGAPTIWTYYFTVTSFGFFMLGHLACLAGRRWRSLATPALGLAMLVCSFAIMLWGDHKNFDGTRLWGSVLLFALALPGLFEATKEVRWMNQLGDLSYPVYLAHGIVMSLVVTWLVAALLPFGNYPLIGAAMLVTVLASWAVHKAIEQPVAALMRKARWRPVPAE